MLSAASSTLAEWKAVPVQVYTAGTNNADKNKAATNNPAQIMPGQKVDTGTINNDRDIQIAGAKTFIKAGDILFAVMDTAVNSDQPGPILATIVSGKLKGSKLIGSFNLPTNSDRMLITFNLISIPGSNKTTSINAYAIDPNTGRTALSTRANHHYLLRYGSLFASTFLQGFGNAFQAAGTTITIGGTGDVQQTTVQNGVGRSILENAVIGLATLGKNWAQVAQQQFSTPTTVEVNSGTALGVLFMQDINVT